MCLFIELDQYFIYLNFLTKLLNILNIYTYGSMNESLLEEFLSHFEASLRNNLRQSIPNYRTNKR